MAPNLARARVVALGTAVRTLELVSSLRSAVPGATVSWHPRWDPEVSAFHRHLGGEAWLAEEVLRRLIDDQTVHTKRVALLRLDGAPWAVVPLRFSGREWQPLLRGVAEPFPHFLATARREDVYAALNRGVLVRNSTENPTRWRNRRWFTADICYDLHLDEPPERYWRQTGRWKSVVQARKRTAGFSLVRDDPGGAAWVVDSWREQWNRGGPADGTAKWRDRKVFDEWGLDTGAVRSWTLIDGNRRVGGCIGVVNQGEMVFQTVYRDREYDRYGIGNRLFAEAVLSAYDEGMRLVSFGPGFRYKRWWARPSGVSYTCTVAPLPVHALNWAADRIAERKGQR